MFAVSGLHIISLFLIPTICLPVMADYDPDISNGTCYYTDGEEAPSRFIPCGNAALGHKSCCESLDMCLSSHACYNGQYGVTYLAGCTDSDYEDSSCPDKGDFSDLTWAGLVYCNGTSNEWVACEDVGSTVSVPSPCWCPSTSREVAFTDAPRLQNIMSLPASLGGSVTWEDGNAYSSEHSLVTLSSSASTSASTFASSSSTDYSITTLLPPASASTGSDPATAPTPQTTSSLPQTTAIPPSPMPAPASSSANLDIGQKIGIALGSIGGAAAVFLLLWLAVRCMRRREKDVQAENPISETAQPPPETAQTDPEIRSPAWSGHKSELPADPERPQSVEVEGSPVPLSVTRPTIDGGYVLPGHRGTYYEMAG